MILRKLKILFIDDQPDYVQPIAAYLEQTYQHTTTCIPTAERAQRDLAKNSYDLIFLDYRLPGVSGIDFLRWANETKLETPIIMVTGQGGEGVAVEAMKLGAYDYLNKMDVKMDHLPVAINNAFERFVLRKAKEELDEERLTREKNALAIRIFQDTVRSFINRINNDLANILVRVKVYGRHTSEKGSADDSNKEVATMLGEIEYSAKAIEATVSALVSLNQTVTNLVEVQKKAVDLRQELEKTLGRMENGKRNQ